MRAAVWWVASSHGRPVPELVKLAAAGITFASNYLLRKTLLFARARSARTPESLA